MRIPFGFMRSAPAGGSGWDGNPMTHPQLLASFRAPAVYKSGTTWLAENDASLILTAAGSHSTQTEGGGTVSQFEAWNSKYGANDALKDVLIARTALTMLWLGRAYTYYSQHKFGPYLVGSGSEFNIYAQYSGRRMLYRGSLVGTAADATPDIPRLYALCADAESGDFYWDNDAPINIPVAAVPLAARRTFEFGGQNGYDNGRLHAFCIFGAKLSPADIAALRAFCSDNSDYALDEVTL